MSSKRTFAIGSALIASVWSCSLSTADAGSSARRGARDAILDLLTEAPPVSAIDVEFRAEIREDPSARKRPEDLVAELPEQLREQYSRGLLSFGNPPPANRVVRERYRIAADGSSRVDRSDALPLDAPAGDARWSETAINVRGAEEPGLPAPWHSATLFWDSKFATISRSRVYIRDWRFLGTPAFAGNRLDPARLIVGKPPLSSRHEHIADRETMREVLGKGFHILSMETGVEWQSDRLVDRLTLGLATGKRAVDLVVDSKDPRICHEITGYDKDGALEEIIRTDRFEPAENGRLYPREVEIIRYSGGKEVRRTQMTVTHVHILTDLPASLFALEDVVPSGWRVNDFRSSPPTIVVKGEAGSARP